MCGRYPPCGGMVKLGAAVALFGLLVVSSVVAGTYTARVVGVMDSDTIKVLDSTRVQHKVRLVGIDAPEKAQPFGQKAKQHLASQVFGREVTLDCGKVDRYQREICVVLLEGQDVNLAQVKAGLAWWYRQYAREQKVAQQHAYAEAEETARDARRGLWANDSPTPPWEWGHRGHPSSAKEW